jgi:hypothetical protein
MKQVNSILIILLFVTAGCGGGNKQSADDIITVDVTTVNYPQKELILQDFMDVEYIPLETNDDFINQGIIQDIGKEIILVRNQIDDGNIFIYDRTGKALRKINNKGNSSEEYTSIFTITLDEDNGEMFVNDIMGRKIVVCDLYGNFKRSFKPKGPRTYHHIFNCDGDNLICYDNYNEEAAFFIVSKRDGSITKEIKTPFKKRILLEKYWKAGEITYLRVPKIGSIIPYNDNWLLSEISSDTVYTFLPDYSLRPFIVKTPPVQSMDPEICLFIRLISDRYCFMETVENTFNYDTKKGLTTKFLMYDRQEKAFWKYAVYNDDFSIKKEIYMNWLNPVNYESALCQSIGAHELVESYEKGELKGRLKEIAATLDEDSNPVIMLVKHKK